MRRLLVSLLLAFTPLTWAGAQVNGGSVDLLEFTGKTALVAVEAHAAKKGDLVQSAKEALFERLLYSGIEGLNDGRRMLNKSREQLKTKDYVANFYKKRMPAYIWRDDAGKNDLIEQLGSTVQSSDGYTATFLISIKYNVLVRDLKTEGLLNQ